MNFDFSQEPLLRMGVFVALFTALIVGEHFFPRRRFAANRRRRWQTNFLMLLSGMLLMRLFFPLAATGAALFAEQNALGLFQTTNLPTVPVWIISLLVLDCIIYWQHRLLHTIPWLWRLHKAHHTDLDLDATTGIRFHPLEIFASLLLKIGIILLFGIPAGAVLLFEILLNGFSLFTHANLAIPPKPERLLRLFVVTPDMHRIHHSIDRVETDSNFGFNLSLWDRIFRSYKAKPKLDTRTMPLGLPEYRQAEQVGFVKLLRIPFSKN